MDTRYSLRHNSNITNANKRSLFVRPLACPSNSFLTTLRQKNASSDPNKVSRKKLSQEPDWSHEASGIENPCLRRVSNSDGNKLSVSFLSSTLRVAVEAFRY